MQNKPLTKSQLTQQKRDLSSRVVTAALHLLHDSHLYGTSLWPKKGFNVGYGISSELKDGLWIFCNAYGHEFIPQIGRLGINTQNTPYSRVKKQFDAIELILSEAIYDNIHFELELSDPDSKMWFKITSNN